MWRQFVLVSLLLFSPLACTPLPGQTAAPAAGEPSVASAALPTSTVAPTYTPLPTLTPYPTYTPVPTSPAPVTSVIPPDIVDATFAKLINDYRLAHGRSPLKLSYALAYITAANVELLMLSKDAPNALSTRDLMPSNYSWRTYSFWGTSESALSVNSPQRALEQLIAQTQDNPEAILDPSYRDLGAAWLCNGSRCAFYAVFGK